MKLVHSGFLIALAIIDYVMTLLVVSTKYNINYLLGSQEPFSESVDVQRHYRSRMAGFMAQVLEPPSRRVGRQSSAHTQHEVQENRERPEHFFEDGLALTRERPEHFFEDSDHGDLQLEEDLELDGGGEISVLDDDEAADATRIYQYRQQNSLLPLPESRNIPVESFRARSGLDSLLIVVIYDCGMRLTFISCDDIVVLFVHAAGSSGQRARSGRSRNSTPSRQMLSMPTLVAYCSIQRFFLLWYWALDTRRVLHRVPQTLTTVSFAELRIV